MMATRGSREEAASALAACARLNTEPVWLNLRNKEKDAKDEVKPWSRDTSQGVTEGHTGL